MKADFPSPTNGPQIGTLGSHSRAPGKGPPCRPFLPPPQGPSKAQDRCSFTQAPCLGPMLYPMSLKCHMGQPKDQRAELLLLPLVPRCPAYPQQPFASSWQWPGRPQPQIQTSKGGAVFPHPALGLLSAGTAHGGPAEVGPALCRCDCDNIFAGPSSHFPQAAKHPHPPRKNMFTDLH